MSHLRCLLQQLVTNLCTKYEIRIAGLIYLLPLALENKCLEVVQGHSTFLLTIHWLSRSMSRACVIVMRQEEVLRVTKICIVHWQKRTHHPYWYLPEACIFVLQSNGNNQLPVLALPKFLYIGSSFHFSSANQSSNCPAFNIDVFLKSCTLIIFYTVFPILIIQAVIIFCLDFNHSEFS